MLLERKVCFRFLLDEVAPELTCIYSQIELNLVHNREMLNNGRLFQRQFIRALTIKQAPQVSISQSIISNSTSNAKNIEDIEALPNLKTKEAVTMEALGTPPSVMSIGTPPSLPVYVRRRTLLTIQGVYEHMSISNETRHFFKRLLYGNFVSRYQKLVGTEPFSLLVTSNPPSLLPSLYLNRSSRAFASINLDGINDWAILKPDALHAYAGPSLNIGMYRLPLRISRQLARRINLSDRESTGLFRWTRSGYTFVNGRGSIGLAANGVIYSVDVADGEEVSVNRDNLVALSVNGPYDLRNCVVNYTFRSDGKIPVAPAPPKMAQINSWSDFVVNTKYYWWKLSSFVQRFRRDPPKLLVGYLDFVRVIGPRTILLQSGSKHQSFERNFLLPTIAPPKVTTTGPPGTEVEKTPSDYLNVVTIDPVKGPSIASASDFKDAVKELEKHRT